MQNRTMIWKFFSSGTCGDRGAQRMPISMANLKQKALEKPHAQFRCIRSSCALFFLPNRGIGTDGGVTCLHMQSMQPNGSILTPGESYFVDGIKNGYCGNPLRLCGFIAS
jgi:hypothetical protein